MVILEPRVIENRVGFTWRHMGIVSRRNDGRLIVHNDDAVPLFHIVHFVQRAVGVPLQHLIKNTHWLVRIRLCICEEHGQPDVNVGTYGCSYPLLYQALSHLFRFKHCPREACNVWHLTMRQHDLLHDIIAVQIWLTAQPLVLQHVHCTNLAPLKTESAELRVYYSEQQQCDSEAHIGAIL